MGLAPSALGKNVGRGTGIGFGLVTLTLTLTLTASSSFSLSLIHLRKISPKIPKCSNTRVPTVDVYH